MILKNPFIVVDEFMETEELNNEKANVEQAKQKRIADEEAQNTKLLDALKPQIEVSAVDEVKEKKMVGFEEKNESAEKLEDNSENPLKKEIIIDENTNLEIAGNSDDKESEMDAIIEDNT